MTIYIDQIGGIDKGLYQGQTCVIKKWCNQREIQVTATMSEYPQFVGYYGHDDDNLYIEYLDSWHFDEAIIPKDKRWDIVVDLIDVLTAMYKEDISHNDIHTGNVLVTKDHRVKVIDWGCAERTFNWFNHYDTDATMITAYIARMLGKSHDTVVEAIPGVYWRDYGFNSAVYVPVMKECVWYAVCRDLLRSAC